MFLRFVSPICKSECNAKVVPDLLLDDMGRVYIPTTKSAAESDHWTFKATDLALSDDKKILGLKDQMKDLALSTAVYIHGCFESADAISVRTILNGYLQRGDHNILILDLSVLGTSYLATVLSINEIGNRLGDFFRRLEDVGIIKTSNIHVIGHSAGAHIAGALCKNLGNVKRLTGLDPAGPIFKWIKKEDVIISKEDAEYVELIHTDTRRFGIDCASGHANFYPNGGVALQPGCKTCYDIKLLTPKRLCSHWRSWEFFAESLMQEEAFLAAEAESWDDFKKGKTSKIIPMGLMSPSGSSGHYFLQTNGTRPYGRGKEGLKYVDKLNVQ